MLIEQFSNLLFPLKAETKKVVKKTTIKSFSGLPLHFFINISQFEIRSYHLKALPESLRVFLDSFSQSLNLILLCVYLHLPLVFELLQVQVVVPSVLHFLAIF